MGPNGHHNGSILLRGRSAGSLKSTLKTINLFGRSLDCTFRVSKQYVLYARFNYALTSVEEEVNPLLKRSIKKNKNVCIFSV